MAGSEVCADCGTLNPRWASLNRGVLLCDECSCLHRALGRHLSQVKSMRKTRWRPSQLTMVRQLAADGANDYWEHLLLDPGSRGGSGSGSKGSRRKPGPRDPVQPNKSEFIRDKYQFLAFFKPIADCTPEDLNQQLHASARTADLKSSLYLLAQGADPNYAHPSRGGTTAVHVACQHNQVLQVELLLCYGGNPLARDGRGFTPFDLAQEGAHLELCDVLVQAHYELTDSLCYYLTRQVPDHRRLEHFRLPETINNSAANEEAEAEARRKLQELGNNAFQARIANAFSI